MKKAHLTESFATFVPEEFAAYCADLLLKYKAKLTVKEPRRTKSGDYKPPAHGYEQHKVTVNSDLNPYYFLLVYIHEMAHVKTWDEYDHKVLPHGEEWKHSFRLLTKPVLASGKLPKELQAALIRFFIKTPATFIADTKLHAILRSFDENNETEATILLETLHIGNYFSLRNGMRMKLEKRLRSWYLCTNIDNKKTYKVKGNAEVIAIDQPDS